MGLRVCLADLGGGALEQAAAEVALVTRGGPADVLAVPTDVSKLEEVQRLKDRVYDTFGEVAVLMNNAGTSPGGGPLEHFERWQRVLNVNLWGVINGVQSFTQAMVDQRTPGAIVNTFETTFAKQLGVPLLLANVTQQVYQMARAAGLNKEDGSSIIKVFQRMAGVTIGGGDD
jgi:NAD(P)-dependent dehydrogenase (short-subunit alcohol dehydrogenase family)